MNRGLRFPDEIKFPVDLFHGTSTLFLDSIIENGLAGLNPVKEWNVLELSREVYDLSEKYLQESHLFQIRSDPFKRITEQQTTFGASNFQHGDTYLSPSQITAAQYAIHKRYGSEILTYTIDFLKELLLLDIDYVNSVLFRKYRKIFGLIEACPSPLLIQVKNVSVNWLLGEYGEEPQENLRRVHNVIEQNLDQGLASQQTNFRLISPIPKEDLTFWFINVQKWDFFNPEYNLYKLEIE